jgi:hypothetical protein
VGSQQRTIDDAQLHLGSSFWCSDLVTRTVGVGLTKKKDGTHNQPAR